MQVLTKRKSRAIALFVALAMLLSCFTFMEGQAFAAQKGKKMPYKEGDNISNAAFYIAVDPDGDGTVDKYYYYTEAEIRAYGQTVDYKYDNHGQLQTDSVKGAKLSSLIADLGGEPGIKDTDIVKYMEHDAYHSQQSQGAYRDTVAGLDRDPGGNGSGSGLPAETIIGYSAKTTYGKPDANNVNDTKYIEFKDYHREASPLRGFRQTKGANSAVLKMLIGVVISNEQGIAKYGRGTDTQGGYILEHYSKITGEKIADDYHVLGLIIGMKWAAAPQKLEWASPSEATKVVTVEDVASPRAASQIVKYNYTENNFLTLAKDGQKKELTRSDILKAGNVEVPNSTHKYHEFKYYGYNKPMYIRYQGAWLKDVVGAVQAGKKVLIVDKAGKTIDVTSKLGDYFVAYYYSESKSSSNIANGKRRPLNYAHAVLVDTASAPVEYSDGDTDYTVESGKSPVTYENAKGVVVTDSIAAPTQPKAVLSKYNQAKFSWKAVPGAAGYTVYYKKAGTSKWVSADTAKTTYTKSKLAKGVNYEFKVKAYKTDSLAKIYSDKDSSVVKVTTLKAPALKASKKGGHAIKVKYTNIRGESGYQIYRSTKAKKGFKKIRTRSANKTTYTDKKVKRGKTYYYKVRAYKKVDGKMVYGPWSKVKKIRR